jgi:hypothetical protein
MTTQTSTITGSSLLREQLQSAHQLLEATMADVTDAQADWIPTGIANPLGATYAHVVSAEDYIVQGMFNQASPLAATDWAGRTGISEPMPSPGPQWSEYRGWTRRVKIDIPALKSYAQAVYANTDAYLSSLTDADLARPFDLSALGLGQQTVASALSMLVLSHAGNMTGEISCLKGMQGAKGYPY